MQIQSSYSSSLEQKICYSENRGFNLVRLTLQLNGCLRSYGLKQLYSLVLYSDKNACFPRTLSSNPCIVFYPLKIDCCAHSVRKCMPASFFWTIIKMMKMAGGCQKRYPINFCPDNYSYSVQAGNFFFFCKSFVHILEMYMYYLDINFCL